MCLLTMGILHSYTVNRNRNLRRVRKYQRVRGLISLCYPTTYIAYTNNDPNHVKDIYCGLISIEVFIPSLLFIYY